MICNPILEQALTELARKHLRVSTLEVCERDSLDFHEVSVWGIESALQAAYRLGIETSMESSEISPEA